MARRSKKTLSVALFPFMAVLVCTMGSLIFLLLVTTRQIRDRAVAQALAETVDARPALPLLSVSHSKPVVIPAEPEPSEPEVDPRVIAREQHALALAERERELNDLLDDWRQKASRLAARREDQAKTLAQRKALQAEASRRTAQMQSELRELEVQFGKLTGELSVSSNGDATRKERKLIEQQIAEMQKRLKVAQAAEAGGDSKFMVVPFDPQSGTSRRPILIECTAEGLRFIPEDVVIRPDDLEGFTPRINPILAGSNALVSYWTAWNLKQPQPAREPEPYVLMLVRPSGTVAYYVAMRMLTTLKQPHGYELIEEDTQLQQPELDPGAKAACEAAVKRLLAEREQINKFARTGSGSGFGNGSGAGSGTGSGGGGFARGTGSQSDAFRAGGGSGSGAGKGGTSNRFDVTDVTEDENEVGSRSWERIENFAGRNPNREGNKKSTAGIESSRGHSVIGRKQQGSENEHDSGGSPSDETAPSIGRNEPSVGRRNGMVGQGFEREKSQTGDEGERTSQTSATTGIERIEDSIDTGSETGSAGGQAGSESQRDIGLGSSGPTPVAVEDRRTKNKSTNSKPIEPEQFTRKRWGLSAPDAVIGLEREISIDVEPNRLVVAGKHAIRMGEGESKQETFERIVTVLDLHARDWGQPPQGFYWTPSLRFVVADGGSSNYELVKSLVERAGLVTSKEFAGDSNSKEIQKPTTFSPAPVRSSGSKQSLPTSARTPGTPVPMTTAPARAVRGRMP